MADTVNALVNSDNENGTQSAEWTPVEQIDPDQKVLLGRLNPLSGTMEATWAPSSGAAVFKEKTITESGIYDPQQEGADGYSMVTVDIPTPTSDSVRLTGTESGDLFVSGSALQMYNDGEDRTIVSGTLICRNNISSAMTFGYPETFTPEKTVFSGQKGMSIIVIAGGVSYNPLVNADITINTTEHTLTIVPPSGTPFQETMYIMLWAEL